MTPDDHARVACSLPEAVAHLQDQRPWKVRQAEPRCGPLVMCRCNVASCCVCVYAKAHQLCSPRGEEKPCR